MADRATRGVAHNYQPTAKQAEAENAAFTVIVSQVVHLNRCTGEDETRVLEVKPSLGECLLAFGWIERNAHKVSVAT
jgi:hypothetical protein